MSFTISIVALIGMAAASIAIYSHSPALMVVAWLGAVAWWLNDD